MIALIHIYCSTSLCVIYKSLLIHDIQVLIYRGSTNERLSGEGMAYDSYYNETDRVTHLYSFATSQLQPFNMECPDLGHFVTSQLRPFHVACPDPGHGTRNLCEAWVTGCANLLFIVPDV